jgi:hypothetical protein
MKKVVVFCAIISMSLLHCMERYPYLNRLGENSLLRQAANNSKPGRILYTPADFLEYSLKRADQESEWFGQKYCEEKCEKSLFYIKKHQRAVGSLLGDVSDEIKREEYNKFMRLAVLLAKKSADSGLNLFYKECERMAQGRLEERKLGQSKL